jgi:hypothetical protein
MWVVLAHFDHVCGIVQWCNLPFNYLFECPTVSLKNYTKLKKIIFSGNKFLNNFRFV